MTSTPPPSEAPAGRDDTLDRARELTLVPVFAGIVAALGAVPAIAMPVGVPITAQSMGVMLAGAVLGARRAGLSLLLFLVLVAVGLPLLSGGRGGLGVFVGLSAGFLVGYPVAAYAVGLLTERLGLPYRLVPGILANLVGGVVVLYAFGIPGIALVGDTSLVQAFTGSLVYLPGDLVKAVLAALVARGVHAAYPGLIPTRRVREKGAEDPSRA